LQYSPTYSTPCGHLPFGMIGAFVPYVAKLHRSYQSNDIVDRLNYQYTATMVMVCAIMLAGTQYVGKPIQCWVPAQFTGAWEKYAETYCFIKGSYFLPDDAEIDSDFIKRDEEVIGYYQWVPLMLAFQAFCFYFPSLIWRSMNFNTGINVKAILESAAKIKKRVDLSSRQGQVRAAASHINEALEMQRDLAVRKLELVRKYKRSGGYLSVLYIITKFLYVLNIFLQFAIFSTFLDLKSSFWGFNILSDLIQGREWEETGNFPRVTMCDFNVRVLGAMHRWTVQCVLMINMFTEKIYVFLWFWFLLVGVISLLSLVYWLVALVIGSSQKEYVAKYLRCAGAIHSEPNRDDDKTVSGFVHHFLTADGVFLCRLIQTNGGDLLTGEILFELFALYKKTKADIEEDKPIETSFDSPDSSATLPR
ncbi:hypothetical protein PRIPAC_73106, partial [Pristionchus pacificus]|uniref:Innexin n=1 Tax=Pristionchus pacificus TaxID=54126 RepID=A0A2A6C7W7_PRIPA